jgi:excisionase family DNA binding protein
MSGPEYPRTSIEPLLTVDEVALILRISCRTVWRMIDDGRLPAVRVDRAVRLHRAAVAALIKQPLEIAERTNGQANSMFNLFS